MKTALITFSVILTILVGSVLYAPYLPTLLWEGYPSSVWPANGDHAIVRGTPQGLDNGTSPPVKSEWLAKLLRDSDTSSFLIAHKGEIKREYFASPYSKKTLFNSFSAVKSLVGILALKAVAEKQIPSLETPVGKYLTSLKDARLKSLPIKALLDMKSGVLFEADRVKDASGYREKDLELSIGNPFGPMAMLHVEGLNPILPRLVSTQSDDVPFSYQNINTALLGRILEIAYGKQLEKLLSEKIWKPAGAATAHWRRYGKDKTVSPYCCLYATTSDWLKVARFIMKNGTPDQPFLPIDYWQMMLGHELKAEQLTNDVYSNHIRYNILDRNGEPLQGKFVYFLGQGGQTIYLLPQHDLIVIRFGVRNQLLHSTLYASWRELFGPEKLLDR